MTKIHLTVAGIIIVIAIVAIGFWAYQAGMKAQLAGPAYQGTPQAATRTSPTPGGAALTPSPAAAGSEKLTWHFAEVSTSDPMDGPRTSVTLTTGTEGKKYEAGTYTGSCSVIETSAWKLLTNERTGVICWWAGGGSEIGVFEENGKLVLKSGEVDEGTAETAGFRGNFKTLLEVK